MTVEKENTDTKMLGRTQFVLDRNPVARVNGCKLEYISTEAR